MSFWAERAGAFKSLQHRDFRLFWLGQGVSLIGTQMQRVAVAYHIYTLTGSEVALGMIGASRLLPVVALALLGGVMADRMDRRRIMLYSTMVMAGASLALYATTASGLVAPTIIYACIALGAGANAFHAPARQALVPNLVPPASLQPALTLSLLTWDVAGVAGPALGGLVLSMSGPAVIYLFDAISYMGVVVALRAMKSQPPPARPPDATPQSASILEGLRFVFSHPLIMSTMLLDFFATVFGQATVLFPIFAMDVFKVGGTGLGLMSSAPALGSVLTGLGVALLPPIRRHGLWLLSSITLYGAATVIYGTTPWFPVMLLGLAVVGGADTVSTMLRQTLRQRLTPDHLRGRMTGVNMIFFMGGPQLGEVEAGLMAAWLGPQVAVWSGGVGVLLVVGLAALWVPSLRRYRDDAAG